MALLNRKIDYALLILCYLHHKAAAACAREVAAHFQISRAFVANILKDLCHKGFVVSQRGVKGGYQLLPETADYTLADLLDALDDDRFRLAECNQPHPEDCCRLAETCPIRGPIDEVHARLRALLETVRIGEIIRRRAPLEVGVARCQ